MSGGNFLTNNGRITFDYEGLGGTFIGGVDLKNWYAVYGYLIQNFVQSQYVKQVVKLCYKEGHW